MNNIVWRHEFKAKSRREPCGTKIALAAVPGIADADPTKARVLTYVGNFVANGQAQWQMLDNGDIELRFNTGEIFLFAEKTVTRVA
jgi:hypothetical protein